MRQYETIDWKNYARQQQTARQQTEYSLNRLKNAFTKAQQMLHQILAYSRKLERKIQDQQSMLQQKNEVLQQAQQVLQERKATVEIIKQENLKLRTDITKQQIELQKATELLAATQQQLQLAEQKVKFSSALELLHNATQPNLDSTPASDNFEQFFIYTPSTDLNPLAQRAPM